VLEDDTSRKSMDEETESGEGAGEENCMPKISTLMEPAEV
jgi:hypothetical protein